MNVRGETAESLTGSKRLFKNKLQCDWTKPPATLTELQLFDCSNNKTAFLGNLTLFLLYIFKTEFI